MKITRTQINYLESRLRDIRSEKVNAFQQAHKDHYKWPELFDAIKSGKVKMKTKKDVETCESRRYYGGSPYIEDFFDLSTFLEKYKENDQACTEYKEKLDKAITSIMDKVVLSDLMIEEAVKEFMKL